ncbi:alpha/beta hydrolase, partial [Candidatus Woesearchaeota archaeon]|nr:alpha/beta hydrolase [Candidatus Woesearchaeota archaeon]
GFWSNGTYFGHQREHLAKRYGTLTYDLQGLGSSDKPLDRARYTKDAHVADLEDMINAHCDPLTTKLVLVEHSMGTMIGMELAKKHPNWVDALVLVAGTYCVPDSMAKLLKMDSAGRAGDAVRATLSVANGTLDVADTFYGPAFVYEAARLSWNLGLKVMDPFNMMGRVDNNERIDFTDPKFQDMNDFQFMHELLRLTSYRQMRAAMVIGHDMLGWNCLEAAEAVDCPTLIIHGNRDQFLPVKSAEELTSKIKGSELHIIDGAHHGVAYQRPDEVNGLIDRFLEKKKI